MEISEDSLLRFIRRFGKEGGEILRGIGDDSAVIEIGKKRYAFCQDALVEEIHFSFRYMKPQQIGRKAVYVNVADILAVGAYPRYFMVTMAIPEGIDRRTVISIYRGMKEAADEFGMALIGGDLVSTRSDFVIDVSAFGELKTEGIKGRNMANEGDLIGVTGYLGESAYGLKLLMEGRKPSLKEKSFVMRYLNPRPPVEIWIELIKNDITNAMMDISDGFILDLERMMNESGLQATVNYESLPIPELLKEKGLEELSLSGGEDYQFLFTFDRKKEEKVTSLRDKGFHISIVGEVKRGKGVRVYREGKLVKISRKGYEHFVGS